MTIPNYPLLFERRLLEKVWGARRLEGLFGVPLPAGKAIGESWELSDHPSGDSVVTNGPLAGRTFRDLMARDATAIVGNAPFATGGRFPLLVKFVDASDRLSVQVHPDDASAAALGERDGGKNEAWLVVHADPGAVLWVGLAEGKGRADLERARTPGEFEGCLRALRPSRGDAIALPAGTIHAIGPGFTLCEVQQTSDVTYRVYDWDRPPSPARPLHREQSFRVARFGAQPVAGRPRLAPAPVARGLEWCELPSPGTFRWWTCRARTAVELGAYANYRLVVALRGNAAIRCAGNPNETADLRAGSAALAPAAGGALSISSKGAEFLLVEPL
jgi:mannose-6-phosphate isomerase